jgi:hypothetical protein
MLGYLDEDDILGCITCGQRIYPAPLGKQGPQLSAELVARIRARWGERDRKPITMRELAATVGELLGKEISESAIRHALKERTWTDKAVAWIVALLTTDLADGDCDLLQVGRWLVTLLDVAS